MKILLLNHNVKGVGTYIRCFNFAKHLVRFGHQVTLLSSTPSYQLVPQKEYINGVRIVCMPDILGRRFRNGGLGPMDSFLRSLFVLQNRFDIIENFDHRPAVLYPALVGKYLCKTPLVSEWTDLHGTEGSLSNRPAAVQRLIKPYEDFTEQQSKKIPQKLVVISRGLEKRALALGIPKSNIVYIPGGADLEKIHIRKKEDVRNQFDLPLDRKIIAYTAGTQYNLDLFIHSVSLVQQSQEDVFLITTGAKMRPQDKALFFDPERIVEFGFLPYDDYTTLLSAADLFLFPFQNQPLNTGRWPNKIGDYMAAGRPTVSNRTGDLVGLFKKHPIGLLASDEPNDVAEKVIQILSNKQMADEMGGTARQTAEKYYDWGILARKLEKCFKEVLASRRKV